MSPRVKEAFKTTSTRTPWNKGENAMKTTTILAVAVVVVVACGAPVLAVSYPTATANGNWHDSST